MTSANGITRLKFLQSNIDRLKPRHKMYRTWSTDVPGWCIHVYPSGRLSHYVSYKCDGRRLYCKIGSEFRRLSSIKGEAKRLLGIAAQGRDPQREKIEARRQRREEIASRKAARANTLRALVDDGGYSKSKLDHTRTGMEALAMLARGTWSPLWQKDLAAISESDIRQIVNERRNTVSDARIKRELAVLKAAMSYAVDIGWLPVNPCPKTSKLLGRIESTHVVRYLEPEERARLEAALNDPATPRWLAALTRLALHTGCRRGELTQLTWRDVDLRAPRLTIVAENAKSKRTRHIPLNRTAATLLKAWRGDVLPMPTALVFGDEHGRQRRQFDYDWQKLCGRAGIESFRFHDTRHDFASQLVMAGIPLLEVSKLLGHSSLDMTMRYAHLAPDHLRNAVEVLG